jgi:hypothetical protein
MRRELVDGVPQRGQVTTPLPAEFAARELIV